MRRSQAVERVQEALIGFEIAGLEARMGVAAILVCEIVATGERAGEKAAAERRISDEADAQPPHGRQDLRLDVAAPQRIFGLQRRQRKGRMGALDGVGAGLAETDMADLAG